MPVRRTPLARHITILTTLSDWRSAGFHQRAARGPHPREAQSRRRHQAPTQSRPPDTNKPAHTTSRSSKWRSKTLQRHLKGQRRKGLAQALEWRQQSFQAERSGATRTKRQRCAAEAAEEGFLCGDSGESETGSAVHGAGGEDPAQEG